MLNSHTNTSAMEKEQKEQPRYDKKGNKYVLCYFCKKPIHKDRFVGIVKINNKAEFICDNICCIKKVSELNK